MDSLGDRIKSYEDVYDQTLTPNSPVFIRVDGKAFHTYTKNFDKPFDATLHAGMFKAMERTARVMQGFKLAYMQSDECTFMITDYDSIESQGWFGYRLNKLVSITAAYFSTFFNHEMAQIRIFDTDEILPFSLGVFDARAFVVPQEDAPNVFVWRQKDWERNSIQMLAQSLYSQKELHGKKVPDLLQMCYDKGANWHDLAGWQKYGTWLDSDNTIHYNAKAYDDIKELMR